MMRGCDRGMHCPLHTVCKAAAIVSDRQSAFALLHDRAAAGAPCGHCTTRPPVHPP